MLVKQFFLSFSVAVLVIAFLTDSVKSGSINRDLNPERSRSKPEPEPAPVVDVSEPVERDRSPAPIQDGMARFVPLNLTESDKNKWTGAVHSI